MASTDATFVPVKNQAYRVTFPILDADGDPVAGATGLDSEVSKDAGTFADCTNEATQIATSSGVYYLDLTSTEMNADTVAIIVKSTEGKTVPIVLYPQEAGSELKVDVTHWNGTAVVTPDTAGYPKVTVKSGSGTGEVSLSAGQVAISASSENSIADKVWDELMSDHVAAGSAGAANYIIRSNTAQAGTSTTITLDASASAVDDFYNNQFISIVSGTGAGQGRIIEDYVQSTKVATVAAWATNPAADSRFVIEPFGSVPGASAPTSAQNAAAVWDRATASHLTAGSFGQLLNFLQVRTATAQAGASLSITLDASASSTDDIYNFNYIVILSGTGAGQTRQITDYVQSTKVATVNLAWTVNPSSDSVFAILPGGLDAATVASIATGVWAATRASNGTAGSFGEYTFSDAIRISGDSTAADNAEAFFDGTGYAGTNNVIPTVTTVTNTLSSNIVQISGDSVAADNLEALLDGTGGVTLVASAFTLTTPIESNAVQLSGDATAANNAESFFDGTGYAGTGNTIPTVTNVGTVTGNVNGSVASVTGAVGSVTVVSDKTGYALSTAGVDAIWDDAVSEPGSVFAWGSATPRSILTWLGARATNRETQTATTLTVRNRANSATIATSTVSDDATTAVKGSFA